MPKARRERKNSTSSADPYGSTSGSLSQSFAPTEKQYTGFRIGGSGTAMKATYDAWGKSLREHAVCDGWERGTGAEGGVGATYSLKTCQYKKPSTVTWVKCESFWVPKSGVERQPDTLDGTKAGIMVIRPLDSQKGYLPTETCPASVYHRALPSTTGEMTHCFDVSAVNAAPLGEGRLTHCPLNATVTYYSASKPVRHEAGHGLMFWELGNLSKEPGKVLTSSPVSETASHMLTEGDSVIGPVDQIEGLFGHSFDFHQLRSEEDESLWSQSEVP